MLEGELDCGDVSVDDGLVQEVAAFAVDGLEVASRLDERVESAVVRARGAGDVESK